MARRLAAIVALMSVLAAPVGVLACGVTCASDDSTSGSTCEHEATGPAVAPLTAHDEHCCAPAAITVTPAFRQSPVLMLASSLRASPFDVQPFARVDRQALISSPSPPSSIPIATLRI